jgi:hypothetical protein
MMCGFISRSEQHTIIKTHLLLLRLLKHCGAEVRHMPLLLTMTALEKLRANAAATRSVRFVHEPASPSTSTYANRSPIFHNPMRGRSPPNVA